MSYTRSFHSMSFPQCVRLSICLSLATLALSSPAAFAVKANADPAADFSVNIPKEEQIDVSGEIKRSEIQHKPVDYEVGVSNWKPADYTRQSFYPDTGPFGRGSMPTLSLSRIASIKSYEEGDGFFWRVGVQYSNLERDGFATLANVSFPSSQTLNLISIRAGVDYRFQRLLNQLVQPYVGFALLPTVALAAQSDFEANVGKFILPVEFTAGVLLHPQFLENFLDLGNLSVGVEANYTLGSLDESSLRGFGLAGLVQLTL